MLKDAPVTWAIAATLVAMFIVESTRDALGNDAALLALGAMSDSTPAANEVWRFVTYAWLHASTTHLVLNVTLLLWVGGIVERRVGALPMLLTYFAGVLAGGSAIALRTNIAPKPGVSLGASSAVYAILVCAIILLLRRDIPRVGPHTRSFRALLVVAAVAMAASFVPGVSLVGHAAGVAVGAVAGFLVRPKPGLAVAG